MTATVNEANFERFHLIKYILLSQHFLHRDESAPLVIV